MVGGGSGMGAVGAAGVAGAALGSLDIAASPAATKSAASLLGRPRRAVPGASSNPAKKLNAMICRRTLDASRRVSSGLLRRSSAYPVLASHEHGEPDELR